MSPSPPTTPRPGSRPRDRDWSFHDAGLRSPLLRGFNAVATSAGHLGVRVGDFAVERLLRDARRQAGLEDFGDPAFREGLERLAESLDREADLHPFGRTGQRGLVVSTLATRLRVVDWAKRHPEIAEERIERPIIVLGMPRTGTTLLSHLLDLDPRARSLRTWESSDPIPPPTLAGHASDPRIARAAKRDAQLERLGSHCPPAKLRRS